MRVGPAYADGVDVGPLVTADHLDRVADFIRSGVSEGAHLVAGGDDRPTRRARAGTSSPPRCSRT